MVNTEDLKSSDESLVGSSPIPGTIHFHYVPVDSVPGMFLLRSANTIIKYVNGFTLRRIATIPPTYYMCRGKHIWKETVK